ncbi:flavin reductase [Polycladidibacter hongkongensis]|uniref:flavin reductase n=1 Tax=Polycladidibacter hongkongensis TaxID=1647556 RepID=UPI000A793B6F|nr:flavin reductase [Pseudovibrio hongkongensis]
MNDTSTLVSPQDYREAMSRFSGTVSVLITDGPAGNAGATVSAVCSVSDNPASLLVCLNRQTRINSIVKENARFTINTLAGGQEDISNAFAGFGELSNDERFASAQWQTLPSGGLAIKGARVTFDCELTEINEVGTHSVVFAKVVAVRLGDADQKALVYLDRAYRQV